jgi:flagellar assembly protein FliH
LSKARTASFRPLASALRPIADVLGDSKEDPGLAEAYEASRRQGYDDGFEQGRAEGRAEGLAEARKAADSERAAQAARASEALEAVSAAFSAWRDEAERRLGLVAMRVARRALGDEVEAGRTAVSSILREALAAAEGSDVLRVRVSPSDAALLATDASVQGLTVVADPGVSSGCIVETSWGELDAQCGTFLDRIEREAA